MDTKSTFPPLWAKSLYLYGCQILWFLLSSSLIFTQFRTVSYIKFTGSGKIGPIHLFYASYQLIRLISSKQILLNRRIDWKFAQSYDYNKRHQIKIEEHNSRNVVEYSFFECRVFLLLDYLLHQG